MDFLADELRIIALVMLRETCFQWHLFKEASWPYIASVPDFYG